MNTYRKNWGVELSLKETEPNSCMQLSDSRPESLKRLQKFAIFHYFFHIFTLTAQYIPLILICHSNHVCYPCGTLISDNSIHAESFRQCGSVVFTPERLSVSIGYVITYHLLTESEVITGKSQTEALMYWPSDSEVNTSSCGCCGLRFPCNDQTNEVNKLFLVWRF